jgi:glycosyltransferase involved in cell wall biosynthesis
MIRSEVMNKPKVSVIIPVYNTELYLHRCLDSVINQTLRNIEIICIDDGSTNKSLDIVNEYADKYARRMADGVRLVLITQKNKGAGIARNMGIKIAKGEYLGFVDSDDWIDLNYYEKLYAAAKQQQADLARTLQLRHYADRTEESGVNALILERIEKNEVLKVTDQRFTALTALYRREYILRNNIFFDTTHSSNDKIFTIKAVCYSQRSIPVDGTFYHHRDNVPNQLSTFNLARLKNAKIANKHVVNFLNKYFTRNKDEYLQLFNLLLKEPIGYFGNAVTMNIISKKELQQYFNAIVYLFEKCHFGLDLRRDYISPHYVFLKKECFEKYLMFCQHILSPNYRRERN